MLLICAFASAGSAFAQATFTSTPPTTAIIGQPYVYEVSATNSGPGNAQITAPTGLPAWLTLFSRGNGTATLSGTPPALGVFPVLLRAEDNSCGGIFVFLCVRQEFQISVIAVPNAPPIVVGSGITDISITEGDTLNASVSPAFSDPDGDPLTFVQTGLPAGLALSPGGLLSGVANAGTLQGSPYTVTVSADDGRGGTIADGFVLSVGPRARADVAVNGITATPAPVVRGAPVSWVVSVGNAGPSPSGSLNLAIEFAGTPVTFTTNPCTLSVEADRQRLVCNVGPIASGATQSVTLAGSVAQAGDVYVTATLPTNGVPADSNAANNRIAVGLNVAEVVVTEPAQRIAVGARAVAAGDLNGDTFADAVILRAGESPSILLNIENPTVISAALAQPGDQRRGLASLPLSFGTGTAGAAVALADLDNDQDLDVVVANGAGTASTAYRNDGKAVLTQLATLGDAARVDRAVAVADVNGDGFADVVIASAAANTLYRNQNGTAFAATALPVTGGAGAIAVLLVDVVGTTLPDLIFVNPNGAVVRHENQAGTFGAAVTVDAGPFVGAASADFNRDGKADLVLARSVPAASGLPSNPVYLNNNAGGFVAVGALGATPTIAVLAGDVDGDGVSDVVSINGTSAHQIFIGDGNGNFRLHPRVLVSALSTRGALAQIGRLKRADLLLVSPDAARVFFNDGRGNYGLGDTTRPTIALNGTPDVSLEVGAAYSDAGATATDDVDGTLTPTVTNSVNPAVIGTYAVTFATTDSAGNAATPVTRTVRVNASAAQGGGGGAIEVPFLLLLCAAFVLQCLWRTRPPRMKEITMSKRTDVSNRRPPRIVPSAAIGALLGAALLAGPRAEASDLSYSFIDFGGLTVDSDLSGTKLPAASQQVRVQTGEGDGLVVSGSLAFGERFYFSGGYDSSVVDVDALVTSPLATASTGGNFDLTSSRLAFGYVYPIGEKFDLFGEVSFDTVDYDFGSFAGESFDVDESGAGYGVGLRYSATDTIELFAAARSSSIGEVNLSTSTVDTGAAISAGVRVYFFDDLGIGFDLRSGDVDTLTVSMRFGFGELRAGRRN